MKFRPTAPGATSHQNLLPVALAADVPQRVAIGTTWLVVALLMAVGSVASGQRLYWGVMGGTGLTSDFARYDVSGAADEVEHLPGPRSLILGGLLEVELTSNFAIEADVLHRPLRGISVDSIFPATRYNIPAANTWEFPIMLKWNSPSPLIWGRVRPFLEGGLAFRTSQDDREGLPAVAIRADCRAGRRRLLWKLARGAHRPVHAMGQRRSFSELSQQGRSV